MKLAFLLAAILLGSLADIPAADPPSAAQAASDKLLASIGSGDYAAFISDGDAAFKGLKKEQFGVVAAQLGPRLKSGHEVTYLGELRQKGFQVTLWRLRFADGGDDFLATLSLKDGKIGGYWIK
jgi:hypothetical protein